MSDGSIRPAPETDVYSITLGTALPRKWIPVYDNKTAQTASQQNKLTDSGGITYRLSRHMPRARGFQQAWHSWGLRGMAASMS